jgi:hypothetical protein
MSLNREFLLWKERGRGVRERGVGRGKRERCVRVREREGCEGLRERGGRVSKSADRLI